MPALATLTDWPATCCAYASENTCQKPMARNFLTLSNVPQYFHSLKFGRQTEAAQRDLQVVSMFAFMLASVSFKTGHNIKVSRILRQHLDFTEILPSVHHLGYQSVWIKSDSYHLSKWMLEESVTQASFHSLLSFQHHYLQRHMELKLRYYMSGFHLTHCADPYYPSGRIQPHWKFTINK